MSGDQVDSGRASDGLPSPTPKQKKRVVWHNSGGGSVDFDHPPISSTASPKEPPIMMSPGPDAYELSQKLTKVLSDGEKREVERRLEEQQQQQTEATRLTLPHPRPALKRNTSYDVPLEHEEADKADQLADIRVKRSMNDARHRADQLALSLGSHSAPGSRRNSDEIGASFQRLLSDSDIPHYRNTPSPAVILDYVADREMSESKGIRAPHTVLASGSGGGEVSGQRIRHRTFPADPIAENEPLDDRELAEHLVRSHTRKGQKGLFMPPPPPISASGTLTPVNHHDFYAEDYVPRPKNYRGGVLGSLLKLYKDDRYSGGDNTSSSGYNTPASAPASPVMSPQSSPTSSRSPSRTRAPRSRPSSGVFSLRSNHSTSSLTLTELMKSSSMFAAPGSSEMADRMAEKFKRTPTKPKKEQIRITVHIAGIISRHRYLIKLCRALMIYGAPTHRLEEYMVMSARVLETEAQFLYMPGCMFISLDDSATHTTEVKIVRAVQGVDLGRLRDVHNIYKNVVHDKLGVDEATSRLDDVMNQKPKFNVWLRVLVYGVASAAVAPFGFKGRFIDLPIAFILGCLVGIMQLVFATRNDLYAHVFEVSASVVTSFLARAFGSINGGNLFCFSALSQSSIALILPGYIVLCSSLELQSQNIVAGSVRMVYAMIYTLFLGYGITIGASLYGMLDRNATSEITCQDPLDRSWSFLFVPIFTMCLCIVNQAKWRQTPVMLIMSLAGFCVNSYTSQYFRGGNTQISNMMGALTIGILANLYSRLGRHFENAWFSFIDMWDNKVRVRLSRRRDVKNISRKWSLPSDVESRPGTPLEDKEKPKRRRSAGYSLAAAAMLPAIFVQVPSGLAAGGSLLAGVKSANELTNGTHGGVNSATNFDGTAFNVLFSVIQVAIGISVGLFMSALIVYPLGKRRSGLFSF